MNRPIPFAQRAQQIRESRALRTTALAAQHDHEQARADRRNLRFAILLTLAFDAVIIWIIWSAF